MSLNKVLPIVEDTKAPPWRWIKLTVAYDGTRYAGWQWQPNAPTVQGEIESAWQQLTGETLRVTASGRTDSGVHALGQVVGVATQSKLPVEQILRAMNAKLPEDVVVTRSEIAPDNFHATYDSLRKTYRYQIHNSRQPPLFDRQYVWHVPTAILDVSLMQAAGDLLIGRHDFACFETAGSERSSTVRTILQLNIRQAGTRIDIEVQGDGFLYNMVRAIAGTLVEVGRGAKSVDWVRDVLASRDRKQAGPNAPAQGLVLVKVDY